jgi:hypothetical protein
MRADRREARPGRFLNNPDRRDARQRESLDLHRSVGAGVIQRAAGSLPSVCKGRSTGA